MHKLSYLLLVFFIMGCSKEKSKPPQRVYPITVTEAIEQQVPLYIDAIGNVNTAQDVNIRPQVGGIVETSYIQEGQYVKKGDPLYRIDPRPYQAQLDKAKAALLKDSALLSYAEIKLARYENLAKQDYLSKLNYEQYQADVETAKGQVLSDQADIVLAELNLEWCTPVSPLNGRVSSYNIDEGNLVTANDPNFLINIRQIDPGDILFSIPQRDFIAVQEAIKKGSLKFFATLPQHADLPREGVIYFCDNHLDLSTGTIALKGSIPNEDGLFWPGEFVRIRIQLDVIPQAVLVSKEAIQVGQEGSFVYIYHPESESVEYRLVKKGQQVDHLVVIEQGLHAGEKVVTKGQVNLRPNAKVHLQT